MKLDKSLRELLMSGGRTRWIIVIALCALILIVLGSLGAGEKKENSENLEERVAEMCSLTEGVGDCRVMITYSGDGEVYAVAVLCDGAESALVRERLTSLVCSLFGVGANRVEILKIKE